MFYFWVVKITWLAPFYSEFGKPTFHPRYIQYGVSPDKAPKAENVIITLMSFQTHKTLFISEY